MRAMNTIFAISAVMVTVVTADQFPTDEEIKKLPKDAIIATIKHQGQILADTKAENVMLKGLLLDAVTSQNIALTAAGGALSKLTELVDHDAKVTAQLNKSNAALNWYRLHWWGSWIMLGLGVLACLVVAFLKFTGRLAIAGSKLW
jgi:hypothetical protein